MKLNADSTEANDVNHEMYDSHELFRLVAWRWLSRAGKQRRELCKSELLSRGEEFGHEGSKPQDKV